MFYRGSTVTLVFNVKNKELDLSQIDICHFTIANDSGRNQRTIEDCILDNENKKIKVPLSQNDTLSFEPGYLLMQFKIGSINNNDYSIALSNIMRSYIEQDMEGIAWTINPNSEDPTEGNIVNLIETIGDIQFSESEFTLDLEFEGIVMDTVVIPNPPGDPEEQLNTVLIKNKVYDIGVNPDWNESDTTSKAFIQNKPVIPAAQVQVDWDQDDSSKIDFIKNKPSIPDPQIQSNWSESDNSKVDFIKNKPTKLSDFNNDQGFIDNTVNNLTNYYKKSETYTQTEVNSLIGAISTITIEVVQELPTTDIQTNVIYLVPKNPSQTDNYYDEYINTNGTSAGWEKIGDTEIDLSNYYTKTQTDSLLGNKVDKVEGKGLSTNDYDDTAKGIVNGVTSALADKVDKVEGYSLSKNDYTDADKALVGTITDKLDKTENAIRSDALAFVPVNDTAPYIYRQTPVKESFKALMKKIVGASVVWNQLCDHLNSYTSPIFTNNGDGSFTANGTVGSTQTLYKANGSAIPLYANHKYFVKGSPKNGGLDSYRIDVRKSNGGSIYTNIDWDIGNGFVFNITENLEANIQMRLGANYTAENVVFKPQLFDLTAMVGTIIADYAYTLETAEAGSGIAWLQSYGFFTEDYYAYTQNMLESGCVSAKKIVEFNIWDEVWEVGGIDPTTGADASSTTRIRSVNYIPILPNTTYYVKAPYSLGFRYYRADKSYIGQVVQGANQTFTPPTNARYLRFIDTNQTYYTNKICINISNAQKNGIYEPYTSTTYPISPITLRGLFKLSTDKLTVDGDEYNADGSVTRKNSLFSVLLSEAGRTDAEGETYTIYRFNISNVDIDNRTLSICDNAIYNGGGGEFIHFSINSSGNYVYLYAPNTMATSTRFNIIYPLATPTTEQTTPFTETEIVGSTEEFIDYEVAQSNRDVAIPVGTDTDYYQEMKLPPLPTTSGNHSLQYNPASGFSWS